MQISSVQDKFSLFYVRIHSVSSFTVESGDRSTQRERRVERWMHVTQAPDRCRRITLVELITELKPSKFYLFA